LTVCEVAIKIAPAYGIAVESMNEGEVRLLVADLVNGVATGKGGLPSELERVIRNMADVRRVTARSRKLGEKPTTTDHLKDLIDRTGDIDAVIAEVVAKMKLETRTGTQMILSKDTEDSMEWLSKYQPNKLRSAPDFLCTASDYGASTARCAARDALFSQRH
jgi:hypothetical protein